MSRDLRVYVSGLIGGQRVLSGEAAHYLARVHRVAEGDVFVAFDPEAALEASARVVRSSGGQVECWFDEPRPARRRGEVSVTLLQAPGKSERLEDVVRAATALGVQRVHMLRSERSVFVPTVKHRQRLRAIAIDGARQSGRGDLPSIDGPTDLDVALEAVREPLRLCLHPRASVPLDVHLRSWTPRVEVALLVGPEGGFSDRELTLVTNAGFALAALGPLTLRAELAAIVALGCFAARLPGVQD